MYSLLLQHNEEEQKIICNTMLEYIAKHTTTKQELLVAFLAHYVHIQENHIVHTPMWKALQEAETMKVFSNFCSRYRDQIELL